MIEDYLTRIRQLQIDKLQFKRIKQNALLRNQNSIKEEKYQAYIIDQMSVKNRLVSGFQIYSTLKAQISNRYRDFFQILKKIEKLKDSSLHLGINSHKKTNQSTERSASLQNALEDTRQNIHQNPHRATIFKLILQKFSLRFQKTIQNVQKQLFTRIAHSAKKTKTIEGFLKISERYYLKKSFTLILQNSFIRFQSKSANYHFQQDFSIILANASNKDRNKQNNDDESCYNMLFQKEKECIICKQAASVLHLKDMELNKLNCEVKSLKHALVQTKINYQSKIDRFQKKSEQDQKAIEVLNEQLQSCRQTLKEQAQSNQESFPDSCSSSYYRQIQKQIIGECRKRRKQLIKEKDRGQNSIRSCDNIQRELIQKYMLQAFRMRESMDVARQLCEQMDPPKKYQQKKILAQIILLLTPQQNLNLSVD